MGGGLDEGQELLVDVSSVAEEILISRILRLHRMFDIEMGVRTCSFLL